MAAVHRGSSPAAAACGAGTRRLPLPKLRSKLKSAVPSARSSYPRPWRACPTSRPSWDCIQAQLRVRNLRSLCGCSDSLRGRYLRLPRSDPVLGREGCQSGSSDRQSIAPPVGHGAVRGCIVYHWLAGDRRIRTGEVRLHKVSGSSRRVGLSTKSVPNVPERLGESGMMRRASRPSLTMGLTSTFLGVLFAGSALRSRWTISCPGKED